MEHLLIAFLRVWSVVWTLILMGFVYGFVQGRKNRTLKSFTFNFDLKTCFEYTMYAVSLYSWTL